MKFKHWKEADKRASEIQAESDALNIKISGHEAEIGDRELDVEKREAMLGELAEMVERAGAFKKEYDEVIAERDKLRAKEEEQISLRKHRCIYDIAAWRGCILCRRWYEQNAQKRCSHRVGGCGW